MRRRLCGTTSNGVLGGRRGRKALQQHFYVCDWRFSCGPAASVCMIRWSCVVHRYVTSQLGHFDELQVNTFLTTFGDSETAGLYGPGDVRGAAACHGVATPAPRLLKMAAAPRISSPEAACYAVNVGSSGSCEGSGISPSLGVLPSVRGRSNMTCAPLIFLKYFLLLIL